MSFKGFAKSDISLITGAGLCMLACGYLLFDDRWLIEESISTSPTIGVIQYETNDTRIRPSESLVWYQTRGDQRVHIGDSVFVGDGSSAEIRLDQGGAVTLGERSMVVFREIDREKLIRLEGGNFRVKVDGEVKISVGGQTTTFNGKGSEVQIFIGEKKKPQVRLIKGRAEIKEANKRPVMLEDQKVVVMDAATPGDKLPASVATPPSKVPVAAPRPASDVREIAYRWRMYDVYEVKGLELIERKDRPSMVPVPVRISWSSSQTRKSATIELSARSEFKDKQVFESASGELTINPVRIGENFWHVTYDGEAWSETERFFVRGEFLRNAEPEVSVESTNVRLSSGRSRVSVLLSSREPAIGYVVQASDEPAFPGGRTRLFWSNSSRANLSFHQPGRYYYRFRMVNAAQELSGWSRAKAFDVAAPPRAVETRLAARKKPETPPPPHDPPTRTPASPEASNRVQLEVPSSLYRNEKYKDTTVSFHGSVWGLYSSQQYYEDAQPPVSSGVGLRGIKWWQRSGLEGLVKTSAAPMNSNAEQAALSDLEVRYHHRFYRGTPFVFTREVLLSAFGGAEAYQNSGSSFASRYNLVKLGTGLEMPFGSKWSGGGEFVFGSDLGSSQKLEIAGRIGYFFALNWSFGIGYRVHFFQSESPSVVPAGASPYREFFTEGSSILNYHF